MGKLYFYAINPIRKVKNTLAVPEIRKFINKKVIKLKPGIIEEPNIKATISSIYNYLKL